MLSEPDFELHSHSSWHRRRKAVSLAGAILALASLAWSLDQLRPYQEAKHRLAAVEQVASTWKASKPSQVPAIAVPSKDALRAAALLQTPVDDWFRKLEGCQPKLARTRELRVDAEQRSVAMTVVLGAGSDASDWITCLNSREPGDHWRIVRVAAQQDRSGLPSAYGTVATIERRE